jgi:hypothetical protein
MDNYDSRIFAQISGLISKYLVWIISIAILILWLYFPDILEGYGQLILFVAPAIALVVGLIVAFGKTHHQAKNDEELGKSQYDITITKADLYLLDFIVYGGTFLILLVAYAFSKDKVNMVDIIQALAYFLFADQIKQVFLKKILK